MLKKLQKALKENGDIYFALVFLELLFILGITCNFLVMTENGGRMPAKADFNYSDATHFTYQDDSQINRSSLSDRIVIGNAIYSVGDIIMLFFLSLVFACLVLIWRRTYLKWRKRLHSK
jgi:hypothetical protein